MYRIREDVPPSCFRRAQASVGMVEYGWIGAVSRGEP